MNKAWLALIIPGLLAIIVSVFVLALLLIKLLWPWTIPDLFPGAVDQGLIAREITWNENDVSGFLATYHENARIEIGCGGQLLSKNDFATRISQLMSDYPTVKLVNPSVDVSQTNAVVKVTSTEMGDENHIFKIEMLKEKDQWYIIQESCN